EGLRVARREVGTGLLTPDGVSARIAERASDAWPFAVLVGETGGSSDALLREALRTLAATLDGESEVGRVGPRRLAVVTASRTPEDASGLARGLEPARRGATCGRGHHPVRAA